MTACAREYVFSSMLLLLLMVASARCNVNLASPQVGSSKTLGGWDMLGSVNQLLNNFGLPSLRIDSQGSWLPQVPQTQDYENFQNGWNRESSSGPFLREVNTRSPSSAIGSVWESSDTEGVLTSTDGTSQSFDAMTPIREATGYLAPFLPGTELQAEDKNIGYYGGGESPSPTPVVKPIPSTDEDDSTVNAHDIILGNAMMPALLTQPTILSGRWNGLGIFGKGAPDAISSDASDTPSDNLQWYSSPKDPPCPEEAEEGLLPTLTRPITITKSNGPESSGNGYDSTTPRPLPNPRPISPSFPEIAAPTPSPVPDITNDYGTESDRIGPDVQAQRDVSDGYVKPSSSPPPPAVNKPKPSPRSPASTVGYPPPPTPVRPLPQPKPTPQPTSTKSKSQLLGDSDPAATLDNSYGDTGQTFKHPGTMLSIAEIRKLRGLRSNSKLVQTSTRKLLDFVAADLTVSPQAREEVYVIGNPGPSELARMSSAAVQTLQRKRGWFQAKVKMGAFGGHEHFTGDAERSYKHTIAYLLTRQKRYAAKAVQIIKAWSVTCKKFGPMEQNGPLEAGWGLASFAMSAELLKHTYSGWSTVDVESRFRSFVDKILMPHLNFFDDDKGMLTKWAREGNWGTTITQAKLQYAIFTDNKALFDRSVSNAKQLYQKVLKGDGLTSETIERDVVHAQMSLGGLSGIAETLWHQGIDLYTTRGNLLKKAFEVHASILLGKSPSAVAGHRLRWVQFVPANWFVVYNHYVFRCKTGGNSYNDECAMPQSKRLLKDNLEWRFEKHWGLGTITHLGTSGQRDL